MGRIQQGMQSLKNTLGPLFDKILLTGMFVGTVALCIHLMNKSDAGNDEMAFLVWAETQAAIILGALLALIKTDTGQTTGGPQPPTAPVPPVTPPIPPAPAAPEAPPPVPPPPPFPPLEPPTVEPPLPPPQG